MDIPDDIKMTPWLSQYRQWKTEYPDALLLFRMGDFYELFFDDARTAASVLDITLTAWDSDKKIPMAGVPHHALSLYLGAPHQGRLLRDCFFGWCAARFYKYTLAGACASP